MEDATAEMRIKAQYPRPKYKREYLTWRGRALLLLGVVIALIVYIAVR